MEKAWCRQFIPLWVLILLGGPVPARAGFGQEHVFSNLRGLDAIDLAADGQGNVFGSFRKWRDGADEVQMVIYDATRARWGQPISVPESDFVSPLPVWRTNRPRIAFHPQLRRVYLLFGPESRESENGMFLQAYDIDTKKFLGLRQVHSNQSEQNTVVILPDGELHLISVEIQPFALADYRYTLQQLRDLHDPSKNPGNIRPTRVAIPEDPVSSYPEAEVDSKGNIHMAARWRYTYYWTRDHSNGKWSLDKTLNDFGDRSKNGESCGRQHDGDPSVLVDPRNDSVFIFSTPWDLFKPSCREDTDGPQNLYVWDARGNSYTLLSDRPSYFIADYVPKSAIDHAGNTLVLWPENYGYHYQLFDAATGRWLSEPVPIPTAGRFTDPDPFKAYAEGDVIATGGTFHLLYRDQAGQLHANTFTAGPPVPSLSELAILALLGLFSGLLLRSLRTASTIHPCAG